MNASTIPSARGLAALIQQYHRRCALSDEAILQRMGYRQSALPTARERLQRFLQEPATAWFASEFDWYLFNIEFMTALANVLGIPEAVLSAAVAKLEEAKSPEKESSCPVITIQTDFIRRGTPLFALSALVNLRQINLHQSFGKQSLEKQYQQANRLVTEHYHRSHGEIPVWGKITGYRYQDSQGNIRAIELIGNAIKTEK